MFFTLFNVFLLSTFLRTFAAAKSNEDEGKDIVRYKVTKLQRYKERRQTFNEITTKAKAAFYSGHELWVRIE